MPRISYIDQPCKSVLNRVEGMPFKWSINPYTGCAHACTYCYARAFYLKAERGSAADFDRVIYVKQNAPQVLRTELSRRSWRREVVVLGAATDPYQPAEARFQISRGILQALRDYRTPVSIITKGPMILRDIGLLKELQEAAGVEVNVTIPTLDQKAWRLMEPEAPPPAARMNAVRRLNEAGVRTGVFMAPILPGISDDMEHMRAVMEAARDAGAPYVVPISLRLQPGVREWFLSHLSRYYPHLTIKYCKLFQKSEAPPEYKRAALGLAGAILSELGLDSRPGRLERTPAEAEGFQQMRLSI